MYALPQGFKINEISPDGALGASDEFVELYNAGTCSAALSGWTLKYSSASGSTPATRWTGATTDSIAPGAFFVIGGSAFAGTKQGTLTSGMAAGGGGVGLFDAVSTQRDAVAYGTLSTPSHPFVEGTPTPTIPSDTSAARVPDGTDTDSNSADFVVPSERSPGNKNN